MERPGMAWSRPTLNGVRQALLPHRSARVRTCRYTWPTGHAGPVLAVLPRAATADGPCFVACSCLAFGPRHGPWAVLSCRVGRETRPLQQAGPARWPTGWQQPDRGGEGQAATASDQRQRWWRPPAPGALAPKVSDAGSIEVSSREGSGVELVAGFAAGEATARHGGVSASASAATCVGEGAGAAAPPCGAPCSEEEGPSVAATRCGGRSRDGATPACESGREWILGLSRRIQYICE
jgi:hypothetical protein